MFGEPGRLRPVVRKLPQSPFWTRISQNQMMGGIKRAPRVEEAQAVASGRTCDVKQLYHLSWTHKVYRSNFATIKLKKLLGFLQRKFSHF